MLRRPDRRRRSRRVALLPDLLEAVARELRAGRNLHEALAVAAALPALAPLGIDAVVARAGAGERLVESLDRWARDLDHPDGDLVRTVVSVGSATGGALAGSAERAALTLRERAALLDEVRVLTAQTRASALLLAVAPVAFLVLLVSIDPPTAAAVFTTGLGRLSLIVGVGLDGIGLFWMRQLAAGVAK